AATLVGLNALFETHLDTHALCEIGLMLGADVPFCIVGGSVLAVGIGEIFQPLPSLPKCHIVIAKPPSGISTEQAYTLFDNAPPSRRPDNDSLAAAVAAGSLAEVGRLMCNVLEDVCSLQEISAIKAQMLAEGACGALMSGSGSAVFGLFESKSSAKRCVSVLKEQYAETFLTSPCAHGVSVLSQS
ncbi:MAG: 4-(cytidine 5'-diphospho)-2-C-methyl-D-erythritol kinase, partial [Acetanaerobacterium sp.]